MFRGGVTLDALNALSRGTLMEPLGIRFTGLGPDYLRGTMPVDARTLQPFGLLHGGASVALAETLGSTAGGLCVDASHGVVGIEINANHVLGVREGMVTGTARALHVGRSTQVWEIRIEDDHGRLACISRLTLAVGSGVVRQAQHESDSLRSVVGRATAHRPSSRSPRSKPIAPRHDHRGAGHAHHPS